MDEEQLNEGIDVKRSQLQHLSHIRSRLKGRLHTQQTVLDKINRANFLGVGYVDKAPAQRADHRTRKAQQKHYRSDDEGQHPTAILRGTQCQEEVHGGTCSPETMQTDDTCVRRERAEYNQKK